MADADPLKKTTLSFSQGDADALSSRRKALKTIGVESRPTTILRALIYMTPESDLIARCIRLTAELALKGESEPATVSRPSVEVPRSHLKKLDDVVLQLSRA